MQSSDLPVRLILIGDSNLFYEGNASMFSPILNRIFSYPSVAGLVKALLPVPGLVSRIWLQSLSDLRWDTKMLLEDIVNKRTRMEVKSDHTPKKFGKKQQHNNELKTSSNVPCNLSEHGSDGILGYGILLAVLL